MFRVFLVAMRLLGVCEVQFAVAMKIGTRMTFRSAD